MGNLKILETMNVLIVPPEHERIIEDLDRCSKCGSSDIWNGEKITVSIHEMVGWKHEMNRWREIKQNYQRRYCGGAGQYYHMRDNIVETHWPWPTNIFHSSPVEYPG